MMSTERQASGLGPSMTASSPRAHHSQAVPRDMQRPVKLEASASQPPPASPDRKRPRYEPALASRGTAEEELDELEESEDTTKRPRGES